VPHVIFGLATGALSAQQQLDRLRAQLHPLQSEEHVPLVHLHGFLHFLQPLRGLGREGIQSRPALALLLPALPGSLMGPEPSCCFGYGAALAESG
jgi:hypothetical protein